MKFLLQNGKQMNVSRALQLIIQSHDVDLLIPTCEEIFYISKHKEKLSRILSYICRRISKTCITS